MNTRGKWLARTGALFLMLGFVLPSLTVSCTGLREAGTTFSLAQLASQGEMPLLYLSPLGAIAMAIFSWLPAGDRRRAQQYLIAQAASLGVCLLSIIISLSSLYSQVNQLAVFEVSPEFGIIILVAGFAAGGAGLYFQWAENPAPLPQVNDWQPNVTYIPEPDNEYRDYPQPPPPLPGPRLELIAGSASQSVFSLQQTDMNIGRSRENEIYLPDPKVSRRHARLRFAQGSWFIQDQNSSGGTFINGAQVQAQRLNPGDQITIGDCSFIFRA